MRRAIPFASHHSALAGRTKGTLSGDEYNVTILTDAPNSCGNYQGGAQDRLLAGHGMKAPI